MSSYWDEFKCEMCEESMTEEDHHYCDICGDCRDGE
jgi:Zn finger protein HypA/HybF involved in hydrogenase expression